MLNFLVSQAFRTHLKKGTLVHPLYAIYAISDAGDVGHIQSSLAKNIIEHPFVYPSLPRPFSQVSMSDVQLYLIEFDKDKKEATRLAGLTAQSE